LRNPFKRHLRLAVGLALLYASLSSYSALWPFIVEKAGVDSASYGGFLSLGSILSVFVRYLSLLTNSLGWIALIGAMFSALSSAVLLGGYTYRTIFLSTILQRIGLSASMMSRGLLTGMEVPETSKGLFTGGMISAGQVGTILGVNLGLLLFFLSGSYTQALLACMALSALSVILLYPWLKVRLSRNRLTPRLLIPKGGQVRRLVFISCLDAFVWGGVFGFVFVLAPTYLGASEADIGLARTVMVGLMIPLNVAFGLLSDRLRMRKGLLIFSEFVGSVSLLYYALCPAPLTIVIFGLLMGIVASSWGPVILAFFTELAKKEELGEVLSSWSVLTGVSRTIYPIVGGALISRFGIPFFFELSSVLLLGVTASIGLLVREPR